MKKFIALVLALVMILSVCTMAFAKIDIKQSDVGTSLMAKILDRIFPQYHTLLKGNTLAQNILKSYDTQVEAWAEDIGERVYAKVFEKTTASGTDLDILKVMHLSSDTNLGKFVQYSWDKYAKSFAQKTIAQVVGERVASTMFYLVSFYPYNK